jgi:hypothetical protein
MRTHTGVRQVLACTPLTPGPSPTAGRGERWGTIYRCNAPRLLWERGGEAKSEVARGRAGSGACGAATLKGVRGPITRLVAAALLASVE